MRFRAEHLRPHDWTPPQTLHIPDWCGCTGGVPAGADGWWLVAARADLESRADRQPHAAVRAGGAAVRGPACSWRDMRKIRHILANAERLKGEYDALMQCVDRTTVATWKRAIAVMDTINGCEISHVQPSHALGNRPPCSPCHLARLNSTDEVIR